MPHERTITIAVDAPWYNIPTVIDGRQVSEKDAADSAMQHTLLGKGYPSRQAVERAARLHSKTPRAPAPWSHPLMPRPRGRSALPRHLQSIR